MLLTSNYETIGHTYCIPTKALFCCEHFVDVKIRICKVRISDKYSNKALKNDINDKLR